MPSKRLKENKSIKGHCDHCWKKWGWEKRTFNKKEITEWDKGITSKEVKIFWVIIVCGCDHLLFIFDCPLFTSVKSTSFFSSSRFPFDLLRHEFRRWNEKFFSCLLKNLKFYEPHIELLDEYMVVRYILMLLFALWFHDRKWYLMIRAKNYFETVRNLKFVPFSNSIDFS